MTYSEKPVLPDTRRRKLDDLFGDEPFLSATMKARRLYERPQDNGAQAAYALEAEMAGSATRTERPSLTALIQEEADTESSELRLLNCETSAVAPHASSEKMRTTTLGANPLPRIPETPARLRTRPAPVSKAAEEVPNGLDAPDRYVSLHSAAAHMRAERQLETVMPEAGKLRRFYHEVLLEWLKELPAAEPAAHRKDR